MQVRVTIEKLQSNEEPLVIEFQDTETLDGAKSVVEMNIDHYLEKAKYTSQQ